MPAYYHTENLLHIIPTFWLNHFLRSYCPFDIEFFIKIVEGGEHFSNIVFNFVCFYFVFFGLKWNTLYNTCIIICNTLDFVTNADDKFLTIKCFRIVLKVTVYDCSWTITDWNYCGRGWQIIERNARNWKLRYIFTLLGLLDLLYIIKNCISGIIVSVVAHGSGHIKDYKIGLCCISITALRNKRKYWLALNHDKWSDVSTCRVLYQ